MFWESLISVGWLFAGNDEAANDVYAYSLQVVSY